ncbi:MAG: maleylpyruvate isomerase family mycothiol-dependent enzyme [Ilumatobacteraceae bacterium]
MTSEELPPEIGALLASLTEMPPSNDVTKVIAAALTQRPAYPLQTAPTDNEAAAFARAIDDVQHTLTLLSADDWNTPSVNGLTVGELVGHLIGTQLGMASELGLGGDTPASSDHIESTRDSIAAVAVASPAAAAAEFARVSNVLTDHLSQLDAQGLAVVSRFGDTAAKISFLLVVRMFELWTHDNDLRRAVGFDTVEPDADRLWMMTHTVMPEVDRIGGDRLRIVLTGAGGGVWPASADEIAEIAVDSVAFCRRVANRTPIAGLHAEITGDLAAANETLSALATLALD